MKGYIIASAALLATVAYASPVERQASKFTYYNLTTPLASPCDLTTGQDGKIYASCRYIHRKQDRKLTEYDIPYKLPVLGDSVLPSDVQGRVTGACVVQPGKNGKIYAATGVRNEFAIFDPEDNSVTVLETGNPLGNLQPFNDAWPGETGMFFSQTTGNVINLIDYNTNAIKTWNVPTPLAGPLGMTVASDGNLWFVEMFANKIARLNPTTGAIDEFSLPLTLATPTVMRAETEGRYLWFTCLATNSLGRFDINTLTAKAFPLLATPIEDTVDSNGNIWFSTLLRNTLNYLTPSTGQVTEIKQPVTFLPPAADIAIHYEPSDNTMWFTELANNRIGKYQI
ncbi:hypothetical protein AC579_1213 [Pseudocercospora musae]|uniref:SMP-30/Gluconolactonase/LRE-like region domain-containing protein n=1 Tax=Pseudocercospora musae TaxID=113226 RepID=A0A139HZD4_9PEZI|nr:hypothetical protein AC579_1213 [Pseudocercospora musae]